MNGLAGVKPMAFVLTRDMAQSIRFYTEVLRLPHVSTDDYGTVLDLAGVQLRVTTIPDHTASPHPVLGWQIADMDATVADLTRRGVKFTIYPGFGQDERGVWSAPDGSAKVAWFSDPDGNVLSLTQC
jgi:catechol 2,3-dioxygenase-like lactoylglutathione lyase family enzyme